MTIADVRFQPTARVVRDEYFGASSLHRVAHKVNSQKDWKANHRRGHHILSADEGRAAEARKRSTRHCAVGLVAEDDS